MTTHNTRNEYEATYRTLRVLWAHDKRLPRWPTKNVVTRELRQAGVDVTAPIAQAAMNSFMQREYTLVTVSPLYLTSVAADRVRNKPELADTIRDMIVMHYRGGRHE